MDHPDKKEPPATPDAVLPRRPWPPKTPAGARRPRTPVVIETTGEALGPWVEIRRAA